MHAPVGGTPAPGLDLDALNRRLNAALALQKVTKMRGIEGDTDAFYRAMDQKRVALMAEEHKPPPELAGLLKNGRLYQAKDGSYYVIVRTLRFLGFGMCVGVTVGPRTVANIPLQVPSKINWVVTPCPADYKAPTGSATPQPDITVQTTK